MVAYLTFFLIVALIFGIAAMGLNLQWGFTGLFNAGVMGFYAIGAYAMAILCGPDRPGLIGGFELPYVVGLLGAMVFAGIGAVIVGLATLRLRTHYLAIATFGIAVSIQMVALNYESLTRGTLGITGIPKPVTGLFETSFGYNLFYLAYVAVIALVVYLALESIVRSPWGRVLRAIREDETAAVALGKSALRFRMQAFVLGCMIIGLAGALYVSFIGYVSPMDFLPILTFQIWTMLIVGGSGNNKGAVLGAIVVWGIWTSSGILVSGLLPARLQVQGAAGQVVLIGLILILVLIFRPRGLIGEEAEVSRYGR
jgi:branched-chain amino acid transport system permease protein